ncbi:hypothetical protein [Methylobacterium longum]|uniref:hypothetical protein n=1 Tax=Methylobacterium longum TaxID=767694 RepID=UPI003F495515
MNRLISARRLAVLSMGSQESTSAEMSPTYGSYAAAIESPSPHFFGNPGAVEGHTAEFDAVPASKPIERRVLQTIPNVSALPARQLPLDVRSRHVV